jgi:hypothetical protein
MHRTSLMGSADIWKQMGIRDIIIFQTLNVAAVLPMCGVIS